MIGRRQLTSRDTASESTLKRTLMSSYVRVGNLNSQRYKVVHHTPH
nr:MAG TPA: hypothetical protein [Caudoviricetes sp.]